MQQNRATYLLDADLKRDSEYTGTPFTDTESANYNARLGCNKAGSCAPGIGITTGFANPAAALNSTVDTAARRSQHIGKVADATTTFKAIEGADVNNTLARVVVDAGGAAADAVADVATGAVNRTGATVAEDDVIWGVIPVA